MSQNQAEPKSAATQQEQPKKSTGYRVEQEKRIQINKTHSNRRQRAEVMKIITIGLFGRKRYRNFYLVSSLNNFYHALMIANTLQKRVERLALVINMQKVNFTEYADENAQGQEKNYSVFVIKITRNPTEEDKKNSGYNQGLEKIENPLTEIMKTRINRPGRFNSARNGPRRNYQRRDDRDERRGDRDDRRGERRTEQRRDDRRGDRDDRRRPERREDNERRYQRRDDRRDNNRKEDTRRGQRRDDRARNYNRREETNNDRDFQRRGERRYRQDKHERVDEQEYRRGERKTRGTTGTGGRVAQHSYNKEHLNREQDRKDRQPRRNRYSSDEER